MQNTLLTPHTPVAHVLRGRTCARKVLGTLATSRTSVSARASVGGLWREASGARQHGACACAGTHETPAATRSSTPPGWAQARMRRRHNRRGGAEEVHTRSCARTVAPGWLRAFQTRRRHTACSLQLHTRAARHPTVSRMRAAPILHWRTAPQTARHTTDTTPGEHTRISHLTTQAKVARARPTNGQQARADPNTSSSATTSPRGNTTAAHSNDGNARIRHTPTPRDTTHRTSRRRRCGGARV